MDIKHLTATDGAYGRRFTNSADVLAHWNAGKDFLNMTMGAPGTYISKSDFLRYAPDGADIKLRYNGNADFILVTKANPDNAVTEDGEPEMDRTYFDAPDQDYMGTGKTRDGIKAFLADELGGSPDEYDDFDSFQF